MLHLQAFENYSFNVKEYFKEKINWDLFNHLKDTTLKYSDEGYFTCIRIEFNSTTRWGGMMIYQYIQNAEIEGIHDCDGFLEGSYTKSIRNEINKLISSNHTKSELTYSVSIEKTKRNQEKDKSPTVTYKYPLEKNINTITSTVLQKFDDVYLKFPYQNGNFQFKHDIRLTDV